MINLTITSSDKGKVHRWLDTLSTLFSVYLVKDIELIFSDKIENKSENLFIIDASFLSDRDQLVQLCHVGKVIVIGTKISTNQKIEFICNGALGCCESSIDSQLMLQAINGVLNNEIWLERQLIPQVLKRLASKSELALRNFNKKNKENKENKAIEKIHLILTPREIQVVELTYNGENNSDIANTLNISIRTVKAHLGSIYNKLHVQDRFQLIVLLKNLKLRDSPNENTFFNDVRYKNKVV